MREIAVIVKTIEKPGIGFWLDFQFVEKVALAFGNQSIQEAVLNNKPLGTQSKTVRKQIAQSTMKRYLQKLGWLLFNH